MTYSVPEQEPSEIVAGETAQWTRVFGDFPPSEVDALRYVFRGPSTLDVTATVDGEGWAVTITAAETEALEPGTYQWAAYAETGADADLVRRRAGEGTLVVRQGLLTADDGDLVSEAQQELTLVEARIKELLADNVESYSAGGQQVAKRKLAELQVQAGILRARVWREANPGKAYPSHAVRFRSAS